MTALHGFPPPTLGAPRWLGPPPWELPVEDLPQQLGSTLPYWMKDALEDRSEPLLVAVSVALGLMVAGILVTMLAGHVTGHVVGAAVPIGAGVAYVLRRSRATSVIPPAVTLGLVLATAFFGVAAAISTVHEDGSANGVTVPSFSSTLAHPAFMLHDHRWVVLLLVAAVTYALSNPRQARR